MKEELWENKKKNRLVKKLWIHYQKLPENGCKNLLSITDRPVVGQATVFWKGVEGDKGFNSISSEMVAVFGSPRPSWLFSDIPVNQGPKRPSGRFRRFCQV